MCDHEHQHARGEQLSRRRLLQGMVAIAALAGCDAAAPRASARRPQPTPLPSRAPNAAGLHAYVLAMHLHASTSEGVGSVRSHLAQAAATGFDVAWFTEHDWRRRRLLYRPAYSFTPDELALGGRWTVEPVDSTGTLRSGGAEFVTSPTSPSDPAARKGSLRLGATGVGDQVSTAGRRIRAEGGSRGNFRSRITGRTVSVDVLPAASNRDAWGQVFFGLSHHPAGRNRPNGACALVYRLRPDVSAKKVTTEELIGYVDVPVTTGQWQTITFDLTGDAAAAWPDLDPRDNSLNEIEFHAASRRDAPAEIFFGHLRFEEQAGYDPVGVERELVAAYADEQPEVLGLIGTEISLGPHLNQFGGPQDPYDYGELTGLDRRPGDIRRSVVDFVHAQGGLACINHPGGSPEDVAADLLRIGAGGADLIEVGYGRGGLDSLPGHLAAWDALSRNGLFLTGNGVSDDHSGQNWAGQPNRFYTATWASGLDEPGLLDALGRGRVYAAYLGSFGGTIDMTVDRDVPMGAVSVSPATSRTLRIDVTGLPEGGAVEVVRGVVDYAGPADPKPGTDVLSRLGARDLQRSAEVAIDTGEECFVRLQVTDGGGTVVAFGQPTWLLEAPPATGIPARRQAPA